MKKIIVTITNPTKSFFYDIEIPKQVTIAKLQKDIVEALNSQNQNLALNELTAGLYFNRMSRVLIKEETVETAGIWNGDYITIIEV